MYVIYTLCFEQDLNILTIALLAACSDPKVKHDSGCKAHNILEEIFPFYWLPMAWPTIPARNKQYRCGNLFDWLCMMDESWSHYFRWGNRSIQSSFQHFIPFFSSDWPIIFSSSLLQELSTQETNILATYCDVSVSVSYLLDFRSKYSRPDCEGG